MTTKKSILAVLEKAITRDRRVPNSAYSLIDTTTLRALGDGTVAYARLRESIPIQTGFLPYPKRVSYVVALAYGATEQDARRGISQAVLPSVSSADEAGIWTLPTRTCGVIASEGGGRAVVVNCNRSFLTSPSEFEGKRKDVSACVSTLGEDENSDVWETSEVMYPGSIDTEELSERVSAAVVSILMGQRTP